MNTNKSQFTAATMPLDHRDATKRQLAFRTAQPIRRNKQDSAWQVADRNRVYFVDSFRTALISNVILVPKAPGMTCEPGYESTGEAIGNVTILRDRWWWKRYLPHDRRVHEIVYDARHRFFHFKEGRQEQLEQASYMLVFPNGRSFVWFNTSEQKQHLGF